MYESSADNPRNEISMARRFIQKLLARRLGGSAISSKDAAFLRKVGTLDRADRT